MIGKDLGSGIGTGSNLGLLGAYGFPIGAALPAAIHKWAFDEDTGTICSDSVGGKNIELVSVNDPWPAEDAGLWISANGTETGAGSGGNILPWGNDASRTFIFVVYPAIATPNHYAYLAIKYAGGTDFNWAFRRDTNTDEMSFFYHDGADYQVFTTTDFDFTTAYTMVTFSYTMGTGNTAVFYKNKALSVTASWAAGDGDSAPGATNQNTLFGAIDTSGTTPFHGYISTLHVYNYALTTTEIGDIYDDLASRFGW